MITAGCFWELQTSAVKLEMPEEGGVEPVQSSEKRRVGTQGQGSKARWTFQDEMLIAAHRQPQSREELATQTPETQGLH